MQSSTVNSALSAVSQSVSGTYVQDVSIKMLDNAIDLKIGRASCRERV